MRKKLDLILKIASITIITISCIITLFFIYVALFYQDNNAPHPMDYIPPSYYNDLKLEPFTIKKIIETSEDVAKKHRQDANLVGVEMSLAIKGDALDITLLHILFRCPWVNNKSPGGYISIYIDLEEMNIFGADGTFGDENFTVEPLDKSSFSKNYELYIDSVKKDIYHQLVPEGNYERTFFFTANQDSIVVMTKGHRQFVWNEEQKMFLEQKE